MTLDDAVDLILESPTVSKSGDTVIRKMKSVQIKRLFDLFLISYGFDSSYPVKDIGIRVGERLHEYLLSYDELLRMHYTSDEKYLIIPPYLQSELNDNLISASIGKSESESLYDFASENQKYFFSDLEMLDKIRAFQEEQNTKSKQII